MLQYRVAALAGFATQCWWGAIKIMVYAAFYETAAAARTAQPSERGHLYLAGAGLPRAPAVVADPEVGTSIRTGGVGYDRLRPLDTYGYWYARTLGWIVARALPRAVLMLVAAGVVLPLVGLEAWAWQPPSRRRGRVAVRSRASGS